MKILEPVILEIANVSQPPDAYEIVEFSADLRRLCARICELSRQQISTSARLRIMLCLGHERRAGPSAPEPPSADPSK